jgi:Fe-S cluster assembly iron-binding protein IscA
MCTDDQTSERTRSASSRRAPRDRQDVGALSQATVDFIDSLEQTGFTIDNPAATGGCACSNSFH